jgi:hypothetical protein
MSSVPSDIPLNQHQSLPANHSPESTSPPVSPSHLAPVPSGPRPPVEKDQGGPAPDLENNANKLKGGAILNKILAPIKNFYAPATDTDLPIGLRVFRGAALTLGALLYGAAYVAALAGPIIGGTLGLFGGGPAGVIAGITVGGVAGAGAAIVLSGIGAGLLTLGGKQMSMTKVAAPAVISLAIGFWFAVPFGILGGVLGSIQDPSQPAPKDPEVENENISQGSLPSSTSSITAVKEEEEKKKRQGRSFYTNKSSRF